MRTWLTQFNLIAIVQIFALVFAPAATFAGGEQNSDLTAEQNAQETFLTTEPVPSSIGPAHLEVQAFEIRDDADLARASGEIQEKIQANPRSASVYRLEVRAGQQPETSVESSTRAALVQIESTIDSSVRIDPAPVQVPAPKKVGFLARHYNVSLALVRLVANSVTVSTGLIMGTGVSTEHAILIGTLAGSLSGAIQLKNDFFVKWLSNSVLLVKAAKKLGLLKASEGPDVPRAESVLKDVEMYGRWAMLETGFLLSIQTAMAILNVPITENLFLTVAKSTGSQGVYEVGVIKAAEQLKNMNPRWAGKEVMFKNVAFFVGSGISVLSAVGSMIDMPYSNLGFLTLTTAGLTFSFAPKLAKTKPIEWILSKFRGARIDSGLSCSGLFD